jgi:hypothetical protein
MTYAERMKADGRLTLAKPGSACQFKDCGTGSEAAHTFDGQHFCLFHSPFDAWEECCVEAVMTGKLHDRGCTSYSWVWESGLSGDLSAEPWYVQ